MNKKIIDGIPVFTKNGRSLNMKDIILNIKKINGVSTQGLTDKLNMVSRRTVESWLAGHRVATLRNLIRLANIVDDKCKFI